MRKQIERFIKIANIVYPSQVYAACEREAVIAQQVIDSTPTIVCLCGSTRFKQAWYDETKRLTYEGKIVLGVGDLDTSCANRNASAPLSPERKSQLDELHKRKIDLCDEVVVLNVNGYIGESTRSEIDYATRLGRPVKYIETPDGVSPEDDGILGRQ